MLKQSPETLESLRRLRVIRRYLPTPIRDEDIEPILEVAQWTGSSKNRQSWRFVLIRSEEQKEALSRCGDFTTPLRAAPLVIAPVALPEAYEWDMGRVSQNMMLAAAAIGIGSCPITMHRPDDAAAVLGLPEGHSCRIVISMGYPDVPSEADARKSNPLSGRKPITDLVAHERF